MSTYALLEAPSSQECSTPEIRHEEPHLKMMGSPEPAEVDYVYHPSFSLLSAEEGFFGAGAESINIPTWMNLVDDAGDTAAPVARRVTLTAQQEAQLFLRYNYAKYRLAKLLAAQKRSISSARTRRIALWRERVAKTQDDVVTVNMGLVMGMVKHAKIHNVDISDLISEGNLALLRAVKKFDVSRGFKFSTYACRAILTSFSRLATKVGRYRRFFPTEFDPDREDGNYDVVKHEERRDGDIEELREILNKNLALLSDTEHTVVLKRFAIGAAGKRQTLAGVGRTIGLSSERVRQIWISALAKIRVTMT